MILCERCGACADYIVEQFKDERCVWYACLRCGKMRSLRVQEARGSRWVDGVCKWGLVECSGEITLE